jgi:PIN domain nuclease of toxin-antitoxin system
MPANPSGVLLDTHVMIWWQADSGQLSARCRKGLDGAVDILVSPITFWELTMLVAKGRVRLDRPTSVWVNDFLSNERVRLAEFNPMIAVAAGELSDFHGDPADRIIATSAVSAGVPLLTKDSKIREWAKTSKELTTIW